jgi:hypothetical protein
MYEVSENRHFYDWELDAQGWDRHQERGINYDLGCIGAWGGAFPSRIENRYLTELKYV